MAQNLMSEKKPDVSLPGEEAETVPTKKRSRNLIALITFLAFAVFIGFNFHLAVVDGISMVPTFKNGQRLTVSSAYWLIGPIKDGDIVVIRDNNKTGYIVKRVYKMGGEKVDWMNTPKQWSLSQGQFVVPEGDIFVLGDNRPQSEDSRFFGPVPITKVLGKVVIKPH